MGYRRSSRGNEASISLFAPLGDMEGIPQAEMHSSSKIPARWLQDGLFYEGDHHELQPRYRTAGSSSRLTPIRFQRSGISHITPRKMVNHRLSRCDSGGELNQTLSSYEGFQAQHARTPGAQTGTSDATGAALVHAMISLRRLLPIPRILVVVPARWSAADEDAVAPAKRAGLSPPLWAAVEVQGLTPTYRSTSRETECAR